MIVVSNAQRENLVGKAATLIGYAGDGAEPRIDYRESRPMMDYRWSWLDLLNWFRRGGHVAWDCSTAVTLLFKYAGLRDPNGFGYDGYGNTDSLYNHLPHYSNVEDAHPGALIIFGEDPTVHVAMLMERNGADPWLFSHGQQGGPFHILLSAERQNHVWQAETWLDIGHL
jgi:hypothetical protein